MSGSHSLRFDETQFWVIHRRREYGPFDYNWNKDYRGIELLYAGEKFGEYCSPEELFADLRRFCLPMSVVQVASIVLGCTVFGVLNGWSLEERKQLLGEKLADQGFERFTGDL